MKMSGQPTNAALKKRQTLALARQARLEIRKSSTVPILPSNYHTDHAENGDANITEDDKIQCTGWSGGVSHCISSGDEPIVISDDDESEEVVEELSGSELEDTIQRSLVRGDINPTGGYQRIWGFSSIDDYIIISLYSNVPVWPTSSRHKNNNSTTRRSYRNLSDRFLLHMRRSVSVSLE